MYPNSAAPRAGLAPPEPEVRDGGPHVLVLDDSAFDRLRIARLLRGIEGQATVHEAASNRDLRDMLDRRTYDVILLDYRLPDGDGTEAVALVRHHRLNGGCPTVMIAGDETLDTGGRLMHDKCDVYLAKADLSAARLRETLDAALHAVRSEGKPAGRAMAGPDPAAADLLRSALDDCFSVIRGLHALRHFPSADGDGTLADLGDIERCAIRQWATLRRLVPQDDAEGRSAGAVHAHLRVATREDVPRRDH